jgi:hypothetical protein
MVRPVEPDPPDALRRVNPKVRRPDAAPDKLSYQHISEQERRHKQEQRAHDDGHPLNAEKLTIQGSEETPADTNPTTPAPEKSEHVDLEG